MGSKWSALALWFLSIHCLISGCDSAAHLDQNETPDVSLDRPAEDDDEWVHDFGIVQADTTQSHVFGLQNTSGGSVAFDKFVASCNCTGLEISKKRLQPGESFDITVNFHAGHKTYDSSPTVVALFGGDKQWTVALRLIAKVRQPVSLSVSDLHWKCLGVRDFAPGTFLVRNYSKTKWADVSLACSEPWLSLHAEPVSADEGALQTWKCTVHPLSAMLSAGEHLASIKIAPDGVDTKLTLPAKVSIRDPVVLMPGRIFHLRDADGTPQTVDLAIVFRTESEPTSPEAFSISSALGDAVRPEVVHGSDGKWILRCHISGSGGVIRDEFRVDIPSADASITVPVFVSARGDGDAA